MMIKNDDDDDDDDYGDGDGSQKAPQIISQTFRAL